MPCLAFNLYCFSFWHRLTHTSHHTRSHSARHPLTLRPRHHHYHPSIHHPILPPFHTFHHLVRAPVWFLVCGLVSARAAAEIILPYRGGVRRVSAPLGLSLYPFPPPAVSLVGHASLKYPHTYRSNTTPPRFQLLDPFKHQESHIFSRSLSRILLRHPQQI